MEHKNKVYQNKKINRFNTAIAVFGLTALLSTPPFIASLKADTENSKLLNQTISDCVNNPDYLNEVACENNLLREYYRIGEISADEYATRFHELNDGTNWEILEKTATPEQLDTIKTCKKKQFRLKSLSCLTAGLQGSTLGATLGAIILKPKKQSKKQNKDNEEEIER